MVRSFQAGFLFHSFLFFLWFWIEEKIDDFNENNIIFLGIWDNLASWRQMRAVCSSSALAWPLRLLADFLSLDFYVLLRLQFNQDYYYSIYQTFCHITTHSTVQKKKNSYSISNHFSFLNSNNLLLTPSPFTKWSILLLFWPVFQEIKYYHLLQPTWNMSINSI